MTPEFERPLEEPERSSREQCIQFIHEYFPEDLLRNSAFIVAAVAAAIFSSSLAYVFAITASLQFLSMSLLTICLEYDEDATNQFQLKVLNFQKSYPWLQIVAFLVTVAVFFVFPLASGILGGLLGLYTGLLTNTTYYKIMQTPPEDV